MFDLVLKYIFVIYPEDFDEVITVIFFKKPLEKHMVWESIILKFMLSNVSILVT